MKWQKKGLIFSPDKNVWWKHSYGMMPTPEFIKELNIIRIYFGVTDDEFNGRITYIEVDANNPSLIRKQAEDIVLDIGLPGMFDDCGAIPSSVLVYDGKKYLYYVGFQRAEKVPYMLFSGLASSSVDSLNFLRHSFAPIIDRSENNYISNAAPFVLYDEGKFKMWYWVGKEWTEINGKQYIKAEISYSESCDGVNWKQSNVICINLNTEYEFSVGRPWVIKNNNQYLMWYSIRYKEKLYRLGYAESKDGINWVRKDNEIGIDVSTQGWDSEMICYPAVIKVKEKTFLFYNGNNNGAS